MLSCLSDHLMLRYRTWLMNKENPCSEATANERVRQIESFWEWAKNEMNTMKHVLALYDVGSKKPSGTYASSPLLGGYGQAIIASQHGYRQVMMILRFTGLRLNQVMRLKWIIPTWMKAHSTLEEG